MIDVASVRVWAKRGKMLIACDALDPDDPDHPYNQLKSQGLRPEDFGVKHPDSDALPDMSRADLVRRVRELERDNTAMAKLLG